MTIFVSGMHGVGKTFLAKPASERLGLLYATASQLIREERGAASWDSNKRVDEVDENQHALIAAVSRIRATGRTLLLDGHFVLRGSDGEPVLLPPEVFRDLGCLGVVLLEASAEQIAPRLQARGDDSWTLPQIACFIRKEREHAEGVCSHLDIRCRKVESPTPACFDTTVSILLGS
ncbi:ATP-binding protein [Paraburkholderia ultramafica]|uniref:ATP-binding protein n=1 Tax=Paraburkholderia ultramafica TaxID=1544867 RepID=UPI0015824FD1|nr:ATP-binding protein [Paraburkholderia ultramafica]